MSYKAWKEYTEGYVLGTDEYLLKIRPSGLSSVPDTGFLAKLTQKGQLPKSFDEWGTNYHQRDKLPTIVHTETFSSGWKLLSWRFGQSQNWARVVHPKGFTLEIYLQQFLEIMQNNTIIHGKIQGEFKWQDNKLIKNV
jgi:hypothetical protein